MDVISRVQCSNDSNNCFDLGRGSPCAGESLLTSSNGAALPAANIDYCYGGGDSKGNYYCYWNEGSSINNGSNGSSSPPSLSVKSTCVYERGKNFSNVPCRQVTVAAAKGNDDDEQQQQQQLSSTTTYFVYTGGVTPGPFTNSPTDLARSCIYEDQPVNYQDDVPKFTSALEQINLPEASTRNIVADCLAECEKRGQECIGFSIAQPPLAAAATNDENDDDSSCFSTPLGNNTAVCGLWTYDYFDEIRTPAATRGGGTSVGTSTSTTGFIPCDEQKNALVFGMKQYGPTRQNIPSYFSSGPMFLDSTTAGSEVRALPGYVFNIVNQADRSMRWSKENEKNAPPGTIWTCEGYLYPGYRPSDAIISSSKGVTFSSQLTPYVKETRVNTRSIDECWDYCMSVKTYSSLFFVANGPSGINICYFFGYGDGDTPTQRSYPFYLLTKNEGSSSSSTSSSPYSLVLVKNDCDVTNCPTGSTDRCVGGSCSCGSTGYGGGLVCPPATASTSFECPYSPEGRLTQCPDYQPFCENGACICKTTSDCLQSKTLQPDINDQNTFVCTSSGLCESTTNHGSSSVLGPVEIVLIVIGGLVVTCILFWVIYYHWSFSNKKPLPGGQSAAAASL